MAYTVKQVIEATKGSGGFVTVIAKRLNCTTATVYKKMKKHESVRAAIEEERVLQLDEAESALRAQIRKGNVTAIIFFLKTIGKKRGYVERTEVTGAEGQSVQINLIRASDADDQRDI